MIYLYTYRGVDSLGFCYLGRKRQTVLYFTYSFPILASLSPRTIDVYIHIIICVFCSHQLFLNHSISHVVASQFLVFSSRVSIFTKSKFSKWWGTKGKTLLHPLLKIPRGKKGTKRLIFVTRQNHHQVHQHRLLY